jgi:hypothetical protein
VARTRAGARLDVGALFVRAVRRARGVPAADHEGLAPHTAGDDCGNTDRCGRGGSVGSRLQSTARLKAPPPPLPFFFGGYLTNHVFGQRIGASGAAAGGRCAHRATPRPRPQQRLLRRRRAWRHKVGLRRRFGAGRLGVLA